MKVLIKMGIKYNCPSCEKTISFPDTPNYDNDKWERLVHSLYESAINNKKICWECELNKRRNKK